MVSQRPGGSSWTFAPISPPVAVVERTGGRVIGPVSVQTVSVLGASVGGAYSASLSASGGIPPYSWSGSGLPAGLKVFPTGRIVGTPTKSGTYTVRVSATDFLGKTATRTFTLTVN